ncbi:MAG: hypothetical protein DDG59_07655 [Anaerolineae bacterium]|jgi:hypothetical protein|nr:MAG: hypothetical protein DDG59_07655 [Anaerolineae bacterium]
MSDFGSSELNSGTFSLRGLQEARAEWRKWQQGFQNSLQGNAPAATALSPDAPMRVHPTQGKDREKEITSGHSAFGQKELSEQEKQAIAKLKETDRKVRAHEEAHIRVGGNLIRSRAQYAYQTGPDGKLYAVAGEVSIDTSPVEGDPDATIRKAARVKAAALAPPDPSPQDRAVAAEADVMAMRARLELARQRSDQKESVGTRVNLAV